MMKDAVKILLVEDNPNDVELTLRALGALGSGGDVVVARDGEEGLDYIYRRGTFESREEGNPKVVLLDLKLPKLDGLEVLQRIKTDPVLKTMPIVMLTSSREERDVLKSYGLGVNAYVVKPMGFESYIETVREVGIFWGVVNEPPPEDGWRGHGGEVGERDEGTD